MRCEAFYGIWEHETMNVTDRRSEERGIRVDARWFDISISLLAISVSIQAQGS